MALALLDLNGGDEVVHCQQQFRIFRDRENPMENRQQQFRIFRDRENPMENLSREQFQYKYIVTKEIAADLCNLLKQKVI